MVELNVYAIWLPVLPGDEREAWDKTLLADVRVTHLWDEERITGFWFAENNYLKGYHYGFVWDAYMLFDPDAIWESTPGQPVSEGSTVIAHRETLEESLAPYLDGQ